MLNKKLNFSLFQNEKKEEEDDSGSLQMKNTSGIFLVLVMGGVLGFIVAIIDFLLHAKEVCVKEKVRKNYFNVLYKLHLLYFISIY